MKSSIFITLKKEIRAILREKKSLIIMLLTPFIIPLYFLIFSYIFDSTMNDITMPSLDEKYQVGINYNLNDIEKEIVKDMDINLVTYEDAQSLSEAYENKEIVAYIIYNDHNYKVYCNEMSDDGSIVSSYISNYFESYNTYLANVYLESIGADTNRVYHNISYEFESLAGSNFMMDTLMSIGFTFALMTIVLTAIYTTTDILAGEKERGTLETFLTFPIKSYAIIVGKYLAIMVSCIITALIDTILIIGSLFISYKCFAIYDNATLNLSPITIIAALIILIAFAIFISGLAILISSKAKTYKEAQSVLTPLSMITIIPMFLTTAGIELNLPLSFVPIINHTYLLQDLLIGNSNMLYTLITFGTTIIYTIFIIILISRVYQKEDVLFQN